MFLCLCYFSNRTAMYMSRNLYWLFSCADEKAKMLSRKRDAMFGIWAKGHYVNLFVIFFPVPPNSKVHHIRIERLGICLAIYLGSSDAQTRKREGSAATEMQCAGFGRNGVYCLRSTIVVDILYPVVLLEFVYFPLLPHEEMTNPHYCCSGLLHVQGKKGIQTYATCTYTV